MSAGFVCRWLEQNCPRLVPPVHRFSLHTLTTAYRELGAKDESNGTLTLELATPVLDNANPFDEEHPPLMPVSQAWLLASALPELYAKPQPVQNPTTSTNGGLASTAFMAKMLAVVPSHWTLLYEFILLTNTTRQHELNKTKIINFQQVRFANAWCGC